MKNEFTYGDEISTAQFTASLPQAENPSKYLWTQTWSDIAGLRSNIYGFSISDDKWLFPRRLFREASAIEKGGGGSRTVDFQKIRSVLSASYGEEVVRRSKRMAWVYLHAPKNAICSTATELDRVKKFVSLISLLGKAQVFTRMPDDACPDGPMFFRELSRVTFDSLIPMEKTVRNGIILQNNLPPEIDDRLQFDAETYQKHWERSAKDKNSRQGKHAKAVSLGAIDDINLSKLLAECNVYRGYTVLLETVCNWIEEHQNKAIETGIPSAIYRENGYLVDANLAKQAFREELLMPNLQNWLSAGLIMDGEGTLPTPVYSHSSLVYRSVHSIVDRGAFKTFANTIIFSNAVYLAFLTAIRIQELRSLPFDALFSQEDGPLHDYIVGPEGFVAQIGCRTFSPFTPDALILRAQ